MEFHSMLQEIAPSQASLPIGERAAAPAPVEDLPSILNELEHAECVAIDLASDAAGGERLQLRCGGRTHLLDREMIRGASAFLAAERPPRSCHDLKTHIRALGRIGVALGGVDFDSMLAGFLLNSGRPEPSLDDLYHEHLAPLGGRGAAPAPVEIVETLRKALAPKLTEAGLEPLFRDIEMPLAPILAEMEATGIAVDAAALAEISREFGSEVTRLERECYELAGREFNLNSPNQLREVLFTELKLPTKGIKKTKSGFSTDADTMEKLAAAHPMPRKLLEYRSVAKLKSTYADALGELVDRTTGRIHTTLHQALTATGRLSSSDPNLQNIPTRSEEGRRIRRAFVAEQGHLLLSADYSQIDLRVLAHLSGDTTLVEAFQRGEDIHARTACEVMGIAPDQVGAEQRRLAKVINFGIIYGMGPQRLAGELGIPLSEASDYIKRYFDRLPGVRAWFEKTLERGRRDGFVSTMFGRRRYLPELNAPPGGSRAQAERIAINTPIQGSAADLIKVAMIRLHSDIRRTKLPARILMQVHDELLLEVRKDSLDAAADSARREMEGVATIRVPLCVDLKSGPNWAQMSGGN
jgi:DNA polymerase I